MTDIEFVACPVDGCEYEGVPNSVAAHYSGKGDDAHQGGYEKAKSLLEQSSKTDQEAEPESTPQNQDPTQPQTATTPADGGVVPSEMQLDTGGSDGCCSSPDLQGSQGDVYRLEDGSQVRLDRGDRICANCDTIHE